MTIFLPIPVLILLGISFVLFLGATLVCRWQRFFEQDDLGLGAAFAMLVYAILWALPSVLLWAIWATWIK